MEIAPRGVATLPPGTAIMNTTLICAVKPAAICEDTSKRMKLVGTLE